MNYKHSRLFNSLSGPFPAARTKPYVVNNLGSGSYEIQMYGEVVEERPVDWWTEKPIEGLYIVLSEFLDDLDKLSNASSVTVRINSPGGDLEAGVVIYNRLKNLPNVTTIVDGLAASAASLILQAGKTRKVYKNSQVMIHSASVLLFDFYNLTDLQSVEKQLMAANDQVVNTYTERTGRDKTKVRHMVEDTTWMTGQDIIDEGFADEIIDQQIPMAMSADGRYVVSNGIRIDSRAFGKVLPTINVTENAGVPAEPEKEVKMTLDELKRTEPDLVKTIEDTARASVDTDSIAAQARTDERTRIQEIESIEASIADKDLVESAKFGETPMTARDLAFAAMQRQAKLGNKILGDMLDDAQHSGAEGVAPAPVDGTEDPTEAKEKEKAKDQADIKAAAAALGFAGKGAK